MLVAKEAGIHLDELEYLTVGSVIDYLEERHETFSENKDNSNTRKATQADFDSF